MPVNPEELGFPRGYSHGMLAPTGSRPLFVAGQVGVDEGATGGEGFTQQFATALSRVVAVVAEGGGGPEHVGSLTIYVVDHREYLDELRQVGEAYRSIMGRHFPAMALVEVSALIEPFAKVEIQAIAVLP